jgi:hypothetical protein
LETKLGFLIQFLFLETYHVLRALFLNLSNSKKLIVFVFVSGQRDGVGSRIFEQAGLALDSVHPVTAKTGDTCVQLLFKEAFKF